MPNSMRKLFVLLSYSFMLCLAVITGAHASPPVPEPKAHPTEYVMHAPTMATCGIDTVATPTYAVILKPALGPVAPASLVAVDGGTEYLALIRSMTCPSNRVRKLIRWRGHGEQETAIPYVDPGR